MTEQKRTIEVVKAEISNLEARCAGWRKSDDRGACLHHGGMVELRKELKELENKGAESE